MQKEYVNINIQNFRNISNFAFDLKPFVFLFGPNGSGKTSVIKAILFLKSNIFPLRLNKTKYQLTDIINLENFENTVINSDKSKRIRFEIRIADEHWEPKSEVKFSYYDGIEIMDGYEYKLVNKDFLVHRIKKGNQTNHPFEDNKDRISDKLDVKINVEFAFNSDGDDLNLFELVDNISGSKFILKKKQSSRVKSEFGRFIESSYYIDIHLAIDKKVANLFKDFLLNPFRFGSTYESSDDSLYFADFWELMLFNRTDRTNEITRNTHLFHDLLIGHIYSIQKKLEWKKLSPKDKKKIFYTILNFMDLIKYQIPELLSESLQIFHVPPIRELPRHDYLLDNNTFKKDDYYGILSFIEAEQNLIASDIREGSKRKSTIKLEKILSLIDNEINEKGNHKGKGSKNYFGMTDVFFSSLTEITSKLRHMNLVKYIYVDKHTHSGELKLIGLNNLSFNIAEASSGLQQILPILFYCSKGYLITVKDYIGYQSPVIFIEQPELHLHPHLQIRLLETLIKNKENNLFIETHSEHLIRKIQVLIANGSIKKEQVGVYFFDRSDNKNATEVKELKIDDHGFFQDTLPDDFFDDNFNLARELIYARKN